MTDLTFEILSDWGGVGKTGGGHLTASDHSYEFSAPLAMGGRGIGTSPEELLTSAVCACFTSTFFALLTKARLPAERVTVVARGKVIAIPGEQARFAEVRVNPTVRGGETGRLEEYAMLACKARDRCFIGRTLRGNVLYEVGEVSVETSHGNERVVAFCSVWPAPAMAAIA
ncbi:MAG: OsmC family protein [Candidatus Dormibacteraceae bacterium]